MTNERATFECSETSHLDLLEALRSACERNKISAKDLDLLTPNTKLAQAIADRLLKELRQCAELNRGMSEPLPPNHYLLRVNRGMWPSLEQQKKDLGKYIGSVLSEQHAWQQHPTRRLSSAATAETVVGHIHRIGQSSDIDLVVSWGLEHGWVLANEQELYALAAGTNIFGLGSGTPVHAPGSTFRSSHAHSEMIASLRWLGSESFLCAERIPSVFSVGDRVLFVRPYERPVPAVNASTIIEVPAIPTGELLDLLFTEHKLHRTDLIVRTSIPPELLRLKRYEVLLFTPTGGVSPSAVFAHFAQNGFVGCTRAFAQWCRQHDGSRGHFVSLPDTAELRHASTTHNGYLSFVAASQDKPLPSFLSSDAVILRGWTFVGFREITS